MSIPENILEFPKEMQYEFFSYLPIDDLLISRFVSKGYKNSIDGFFQDIWQRIKNIPASEGSFSLKDVAEKIEEQAQHASITQQFLKLFQMCQKLNPEFNKTAVCLGSFIQAQMQNSSFEELINLRKISDASREEVDHELQNLWKQIRIMPGIKCMAEQIEMTVDNRSIITLFDNLFEKFKTYHQKFEKNSTIMCMNSFKEFEKAILDYTQFMRCLTYDSNSVYYVPNNYSGY